ncbi:hypothetical protein L3N51_00440 [Metallosphaera sp. J1]|uniref:DUF929 domain-containing protein n=1 Tax=Metallosphaera javensis (ex Hofmann et al. 2022) TaxID=99938 RepID=UPI001EDEAFB1|nr:DUF929 domain-containing protein [Metallosphaera javensis (ex Hofmann et al. 2022)]MCG3108159.1 hypothetical protein [Metallosphaera javensis (ex Hofmann et al. 2022)]
MAKGKKKNNEKESRLIYIPFIALLLVIALFIGLSFRPSVSTSAPSAFTNFVKVSSTDYAPNGTTQVYLISWYGCPYGATLSWPLYIALSNYGNLTVMPHYSVAEPDIGNGAPIPGLLFQGFTPDSNVQFHAIYIYNQYLNATPSGEPVNNGDRVQVGLNELSSMTPSWVVNLVEQYQLNQTQVVYDGHQVPIALGSSEPHLVTTLIISGPGGTWIMLGYPKSLPPGELVSISTNSTQLLSEIESGHVPSQIESTAQQILQIIQKASGS